jgi:hypothetical protein
MEEPIIRVDEKLQLDKGWLRNQARIFLDERKKDDDGLLEDFIDFLKL